MKKLGFTLAEVLITLGIIGVVAALTAPALVQNAGSAQIGPKLAKAVSTLELANQNMLTENSASSMASFIDTLDSGENANSISRSLHYMQDELPKYMKITFYAGSKRATYQQEIMDYHGEKTLKDMRNGIITGGTNFYNAFGRMGISKDGILYGVLVNNTSTPAEKPSHMRRVGYVVIDINGFSEPNRMGRDVFAFIMLNDGSLKPVGGYAWDPTDTDNDNVYWEDGDKDVCNEEEVTSGWACAGSIFDNNFKVIYQ